jgi:hypothetical protein
VAVCAGLGRRGGLGPRAEWALAIGGDGRSPRAGGCVERGTSALGMNSAGGLGEMRCLRSSSPSVVAVAGELVVVRISGSFSPSTAARTQNLIALPEKYEVPGEAPVIAATSDNRRFKHKT